MSRSSVAFPGALLLVALTACSAGTAGRVGARSDAGPTPWSDDGGSTPPPAVQCELDVDCDDADPCTTDVCESVGGGEFIELACGHETVEGCGREERDCALACDDGDPCTRDACRDFTGGGDIGEDDCVHVRLDRCTTTPTLPTEDPGTAGDPIDPSCASGDSGEDVFLPYVPLGAPAVAASCGTGIELQVCRGVVTARSVAPGGAAARTLVVDFATYTAGDRLRIEGTLASGETYLLMDTCRVRTWERPDPTDGRTRPPDETIRRFEIALRAGTVELRFDSSFAGTPWYERVLGLCDFTVAPPTGACATGFRTTSL